MTQNEIEREREMWECCGSCGTALRCHGTQHNDTQHNDIQHNLKNVTLSITTFSIALKIAANSIITLIPYVHCHYADCHLC